MTKEIDVFSDASQCRRAIRKDGTYSIRFTGAYIIETLEPQSFLMPWNCESATDAELRAAAAGVRALSNFHAAGDFCLHTDLVGIERLLERRRLHGARELYNALRSSGRRWRIFGDANRHYEHRQCHHAARERAGIYGNPKWRELFAVQRTEHTKLKWSEV